MVTEKQVMDAMRECIDPEIGLNIVEMGLIYGVELKGDRVKIRMTLTTPMCPIGPMFRDDVREKVGKLPGVKEVKVEFVFDPPWSPDKMAPEAKAQLGYM